MRDWRAPAVIVVYVGVLAVVCFLALAGSLNTQSFSANQATSVGLNLFNSLAIVQGVLIIFITPAATSTTISGERQRQTLDLLLVTKLSSASIAVGKLFAAIAFSVLLLICSLPIFSLVFLFNGIGLDKIIELVALFLMSILCFGSIGLLVSALTRKSTASAVITNSAVIFLVAGLAFLSLYLYEAGYVANAGATAAPLPAYFDPGLGLAALLYTQDPSFAIQLPFSVWQASVVTCAVITVACIAITSLVLRRQQAQ
jgi:ABC-type transport system involved in multi-copper enzyme maturation permease subunit